MRVLLHGILSAAIMLGFSCCSSSNEPVNNYKNPFDMTWTCDTLMFPNSVQTMMNSLYVSASKNVWACGHSDLSRGELWKYDGTKWMPYNLFGDISSSSISLHRLWGINSNSIYLVGERNYRQSDVWSYEPLILRHDGLKWKEFKPNISVPGIRILSISGKSSSDFWMGSDKGVLLHYYYGKWTLDTIKIKIPRTTSCGIGYMVMYNNKLFLNLSMNDGILNYIKTYFFTGDYKNWTLVDSTIVDQTHYKFTAGNEGLYVSKSGRLYSYGDNGVWEWVNNGWQHLLDGYLATGAMTGADDNYIFAVGTTSYFYDGSAWKELPFLKGKNGQQIYYRDVWTDGKEVFITGISQNGFPNKTFIWHGK